MMLLSLIFVVPTLLCEPQSSFNHPGLMKGLSQSCSGTVLQTVARTIRRSTDPARAATRVGSFLAERAQASRGLQYKERALARVSKDRRRAPTPIRHCERSEAIHFAAKKVW